MGSGAVHPGKTQGGQVDAVQRIRVAGAEHPLYRHPASVRLPGDGAEKRGFAGPRAALEDVHKGVRARRESAIERVEAHGGVSAEKIVLYHSSTSFPCILCGNNDPMIGS